MVEVNKADKNLISSAFMWKFLERVGVYAVQFILQIILARLLTPEHYGMLSIMVIFTTFGNVFVQRGFSTALIQNQNVVEDDYSSVFWISLIIAIVLYLMIFITAPAIATYFNMQVIVKPFRILALMLIPGALNSVQVAKVSKEMNFRILFLGNIIGIVISGIVGIVIAIMGGGVWALVIQTLLNVMIVCITMHIISDLRFKFVFNFKRIKMLFSFGWKLLVSSIIDTLYQDLSSLVIGKRYSSRVLGFYEKGKQFPQVIISVVNTTIQTVMLPAMAVEQDNIVRVKGMMRNSIIFSSYIIFPLMSGLAGVANPLVKILLTDKWLLCVPYLQINCFIFAFWPVHSSNLQAINAMGRSDIFLRLEIIKKSYGILALTIAIVFFETPMAIAATGAITTLVSSFINAFPNKTIVNYSYIEQMKDILPQFLLSILEFICVLSITFLGLNPFITIFFQILTGVTVYLGLSYLFKLEPFMILLKYTQNKYWERNR
jgi:O-antigen/teichoic acid export membrane protein